MEHYASIAVKAGSEMQFGTAFKVVLVQGELWACFVFYHKVVDADRFIGCL